MELQLDGKAVTMEVDGHSSLHEQRLKQVLPKAAIHSTAVVLLTYTSERIPVRGELQVMVQYSEQKKQLTLYVTKGDRPCIMGREWLKLGRVKDWVQLFCARCLNYPWGGRYRTTNRKPVVFM